MTCSSIIQRLHVSRKKYPRQCNHSAIDSPRLMPLTKLRSLARIRPAAPINANSPEFIILLAGSAELRRPYHLRASMTQYSGSAHQTCNVHPSIQLSRQRLNQSCRSRGLSYIKGDQSRHLSLSIEHNAGRQCRSRLVWLSRFFLDTFLSSVRLVACRLPLSSTNSRLTFRICTLISSITFTSKATAFLWAFLS